MGSYFVKAKDLQGQYFESEVSADSETTAAKFLINKGYFPIQVRPKEERAPFIEQVLPFLGRIAAKDKVIFSRQLSTMMNAGLPLVQSLNTLSEQTRNPKFAGIIKKVANEVEGGSALSSAMAGYPDVFSSLFVAMVKAGEGSGTLEKVLARLADQIEKNYNLVSKIRNAMFYPGFVVFLVGTIMLLMTVFVIPQFADFYSSIDRALPAPTRFMIGLSKFIIRFWWLVAVAVLAGLFFLRRSIKTDQGRYGMDQLKLRLPFVKNLLRMIYMARFARTLGTLIGAGVPVLDAISITSDSVNNLVYRNELLRAGNEVKKGEPLSTPLRDNPLFPIIVPQMIAIGEQTGEMDNILHKLADFFDEEVDNITKNISTLIEPILIVTVGLLVLAFILTIMLPIGGIVLEFATSGTQGGVRI